MVRNALQCVCTPVLIFIAIAILIDFHSYFCGAMAKEKGGLHPRNIHRQGYDFAALTERSPALTDFVLTGKHGRPTINFHDAAAVKCLNQALLLAHYQLEYWDIPSSFLCPAVPGRADYIHHLADLLASDNQRKTPRGSGIRCLDIGTGANLIYPILGSAAYGWSFVGTEVDPKAQEAANLIIERNPRLKGQVELRSQKQKQHILQGMIQPGEYFDLVLCNPPFYASAAEAAAENQRKQRGLKGPSNAARNFRGQANELWCAGGEKAFINQLITESASYPTAAYWYTSLVAREEHLNALEERLTKLPITAMKVIPMAQGNKVSRILAWTFLADKQAKAWRQLRWQGSL